MKRILIAIATSALIGLPLMSQADPDEAQRQMIRRIQEQKQKLAAAQAAQGVERQKLMEQMMGQMMEEHHMVMQGTGK